MYGGVRFRREYFLRCSGTNLAMSHFRREFRAFGLDGTWGDMAVRGAFAVRRQQAAASFVRNLRVGAVCDLRNAKSQWRCLFVYIRKLGASFAVKSPNCRIHCLDMLRLFAVSGGESFLKSLGV